MKRTNSTVFILCFDDIINSNLLVKWNSVTMTETDQDNELIIDTSASETILNWKPIFGIYEGLRKTIDYYRGEIIGN